MQNLECLLATKGKWKPYYINFIGNRNDVWARHTRGAYQFKFDIVMAIKNVSQVFQSPRFIELFESIAVIEIYLNFLIFGIRSKNKKLDIDIIFTLTSF